MKSIAGYKIIKLLAKGGMAAIYLAEQESLKRQVVLKFLNPKLDEAIRKRFIEEGQIIASLKHPNIITVFDVVSSGQYNFLAMEYLEGGDLENLLNAGIDVYKALEIISKISDALHLIHKQGIIHGDIKPANVLFRDSNSPLLIDFGISHKTEAKQEVDTGVDDLYASPTYASPELIQGKSFDYRTDIYSLGIMMYEMLVGEKPYVGKTEIETIANSIQEPIPELPVTLHELQPLLDSLLAKLPKDRLSDTKLVTRFINQYLKDQLEVKIDRSESKLIDSDVVVEYVSRRNGSKTVKKTVKNILIPLLLTLLLVLVIFQNQDKQWQQWFSIKWFEKNSPSAIQPLVNQDTSVQENITHLKLSRQNLKKQEELIIQQKEEINQFKLELAMQKQQLRQEQLKRQRRIDSLLAKGETGLKEYRLTTPLNNNALYYFQKVLELEPVNKKALNGIKNVVYRYELLARSELDKYHYQKAQHFISTGLNIDSDNERLMELQKEANLQSEPGRVLKKVKNFFKNL